MGQRVTWLQWSFVTLGYILTIYALYVEYKAYHSDDYEALCDISEEVSCSKILTSEYAKTLSYIGLVPKDSILDLPNAVYGVFFYSAYSCALCIRGTYEVVGELIVLVMSVFAMAACVGLSYMSAVIVRGKCAICYLSYVCNFGLLVCASLERSSVY